MARKKLLHLKSSVVNQNGTPKLPTSSQIEYGEIAINYADGYETLAIKNSENEIIPFANSITMMDYVDTAVSGAISGINEVSIVYSGDPAPTSGSDIEIFIDENISPEDVDVYTQRQVDDIVSAATDDAKSIILVAESGTSIQEKGEILIDENVDPASIDVYTQSQTDELIDSRILVGNSGGTLMVDTAIDLDVEFYTKAQVDTMIQAIYNTIAKLKEDNHLI